MDILKVSVIIPVFNAEQYIRECLDSVIGSTLKEIEIICIDDGSTDKSLAILKEYEKTDSRIRVMTQAHSYAGAARNAGLAAARGEFIHFLDADDWIDRQAYETWYRLAKDNGADVCECIHYNVDTQNDNYILVGDKVRKERQGEYFYITNFEKDAQFLISGNVVPWNKIYLRKFLLDNEIWFDNLICAEDRSFYFAVIYKAKRIAFVLEPWLYHRVNNKFSLDGSDIRLQNFDVHFQSFITIWNMMQNADDRAKRQVLNVSIRDSFFYYRKSVGTKYEKTIRDKLYNFWSEYIPVLGDDIFEADWLAEYLEISGERSLNNIVIRPLDLARKTFVFSFDEKYVKYFSVTLCSLLTHVNPDDRYEIIILYDQISEEKRKILQQMIPKNFIMRFIRVTVYVNVIFEDLKAKVSSNRWDISTFYDLLIPLLMPGYERVLYCDSDMVFNKNPDIVFSMQFDGMELIAVQDTIALAYIRYPDSSFFKKQVEFINRELVISNLKNYFNGGLLLFNIKAINAEKYLERALLALSFPILPTVDQDVLNYIFKDKVKLIPWRFNYQYHLFNKNSEKDFPNDVAYEYFKESRDPVIVHYTTSDKPWKTQGYAFGWMFWGYARMSPFYEEIIYENLIAKQNVQFETKLKSEIKQKYAKYSTLRIDIRNRGSDNNNVIEKAVIPKPTFLRRPAWLPNGMTIESIAGKMTVVLQCRGDGELEVALMGRDMRNAKGARYPVWIDCTSFVVNGVVVFNETKTVCHDKRFVYKRKVKDVEEVELEVEWSECQSSNVLDEFRQLQTELKNVNQKMSRERESNKKQLEQTKLKLTERLKKEQLKTVKLNKELANIKNGWSFKIGRIITYVPRRVKSLLKD